MLNKKYLYRAADIAKQLTVAQSSAINRQALGFAPKTMLVGGQYARMFTRSKTLDKTSTQESFLSGTSSVYAEHMYVQGKKDPQGVHASWRIYFQNLEGGVSTPFELPPTIGQDPVTQQLVNLLKQGGVAGGVVGSSGASVDVNTVRES